MDFDSTCMWIDAEDVGTLDAPENKMSKTWSEQHWSLSRYVDGQETIVCERCTLA